MDNDRSGHEEEVLQLRQDKKTAFERILMQFFLFAIFNAEKIRNTKLIYLKHERDFMIYLFV